MSSKIDERVVNMKFNSDQFEKGVSGSSKALESLKASLNLGGAGKGLKELDDAAKNFSLAGIANGVDSIASKFSALAIVGITALTNIANRAVDAGLTMAKSLTIDPIKAGLDEYELKMGSIQTILSNTSKYGTTLGEVTGSLEQLNTYADKTIYNFGDMTKNIGLFTNAGLRVEEATSLIKGFSNEAASSGTNAQGAASAAYQLSQALSAGTIRLMDWRSLQNVGMGNKNMQTGLIELAQSMGKFNADTTDAETATADFNGSLEKGWLGADVMSNYLKIMAGDMDAAAQSALGLSDEQIAAFSAQQKMSEEAATKVRTYTQLVGTMQESVGSGWSTTFDLLIGNFDQATELWTAVNNELGTMIGKQSDARNALIKGFVDGGGRDMVINSIKNIWEAFKQYLAPIQQAWNDIFPPVTVQNLLDIVGAVQKFTESLKPNLQTFGDLQRVFKGVFALLDIGRMIIVGLVGVFVDLFGTATAGADGVLTNAAGIADWIVKVRDALKNGTALSTFFKRLGDALQWPLDQFKALGTFVSENIDFDGMKAGWEGIGKVFEWVGRVLAPVGPFLAEAFEQIKKVVKDFFDGVDFNVLVGAMNVGALGTIAFGVKKVFDVIKGALSGGAGGGFADKIKSIFDPLTSTFDEMQNTLKATSLTAIAIAIALITASVIALSFVDTGKLFIALGAMTIMFGQLSAMLLAIDKLTQKTSAPKMIAVGIALGLIAGSLLLMSAALLILQTMNWEELARGLSAIAVGLGLMVGAVKLISPATGKKLVVVAGAMLVISGAMLVLAAALKITSSMSWDDILRSMVVMGGALEILVVAMGKMKGAVVGAGSMIVVALAVNILAGAMKIFATMSWDEILRASVVMAAAMAIVVGSMTILGSMGVMVAVGAAALVVVAAAINILAGAMKIFATMNWDEIGRSITVLAASLVILTAILLLLGASGPVVLIGAAGLIITAAAMMILAPALKIMGTMSWDEIGRGMTVLAASLLILAVGGLLMIPASVGFLLLGAAMLLLGTGIMLASVGVASFAASFALFAAAGAIGVSVMKLAVETLIALIPTAMAAFAQGIIDFALVIANGATEFTAAMTVLIASLITGVQQNAPAIIDTIWGLTVQLVDKVVQGVPLFVDAGMKIIIGVIEGIQANLGRLIDAAAALITTFIDGIARNIGPVANSAANLVVSFVNGVASAIENHASELRAAGLRLATAIADGMTGGLASRVSEIAQGAANMANQAVQAAKNALGIASPSKVFTQIGVWTGMGMAKGIVKSTDRVITATNGMGKASIKAMQGTLSEMDKVGMGMEKVQPTIRPVLDLSNVKKGSALMGKMLTSPTIDTPQNYAMSQSLLAKDTEMRQNNAAPEEDKTGKWNIGADGRAVQFIQHLHSPKPISRIEHYRQTKNLLSSAQEVLNKP